MRGKCTHETNRLSKRKNLHFYWASTLAINESTIFLCNTHTLWALCAGVCVRACVIDTEIIVSIQQYKSHGIKPCLLNDEWDPKQSFRCSLFLLFMLLCVVGSPMFCRGRNAIVLVVAVLSSRYSVHERQTYGERKRRRDGEKARCTIVTVVVSNLVFLFSLSLLQTCWIIVHVFFSIIFTSMSAHIPIAFHLVRSRTYRAFHLARVKHLHASARVFVRSRLCLLSSLFIHYFNRCQFFLLLRPLFVCAHLLAHSLSVPLFCLPFLHVHICVKSIGCEHLLSRAINYEYVHAHTYQSLAHVYAATPSQWIH